MNVKEALDAVTRFWNGPEREPVIDYGEYQNIWPTPGEQRHCWYCRQCGHNQSDKSWSESDAYESAVGHGDGVHPEVAMVFLRAEPYMRKYR